jgi:hypothetical protein
VGKPLTRIRGEEGVDRPVVGQSCGGEVRVDESALGILDRDAVGGADRDQVERFLGVRESARRGIRGRTFVLGGERGIDGAERLRNLAPDPFRGPFDVVQRRLPPRGSRKDMASRAEPIPLDGNRPVGSGR